jgi:hypothetical protein
MDWSGLEVTGEDNLVDGWWTAESLSKWETPPERILDGSFVLPTSPVAGRSRDVTHADITKR